MRHRARAGAGLLALLALAGCGRFGRTPAWELPPPLPAERPVVREGALLRTKLDNGVRVLVHEDHALPLVSISLTLARGAASESPGEVGAADFTAELLERGAGERDALEFAETVDALGASFSTGADWDSVGISISGLSRDFDTLLALLADAALRPRFDPREAERARDARLAALERGQDDPGTLARWTISELLYDGHRYGRPVGGDAEAVSRLDAAVARDFHERLFVPGHAVLAVTGDVEPDAALAALRAHFGTWRGGPGLEPGEPPPAEAPAERRIAVVDRDDVAQATILVGHDGLARTDDARIAASLLNTVLGGSGFSSRLMTTLRSEEGLTYGAGSGFSLRRAPGPFSASTATKVETARQALDLLLAELERARSEPPGSEELGWARTLAIGRFALGLETASAVTGSLVDLEVYDLPEDSLDTYRGRVREVEPDEVARLARELLHPERAAIVLVGPADALVPQLEGLGKVEVVRP